MSSAQIIKHVYKSYKDVGSVWIAICTELFKLFVYKCFLIILLAQILVAIIFNGHLTNELSELTCWLVGAALIGSIGEHYFVKNTDEKYKILAKDFHMRILAQNVEFYKSKSVAQIHGLFRDHLDGTIRIIRLLRGEVFTSISSTIFPVIVVFIYNPFIGLILFSLCLLQFFFVIWTSKKVKGYRKEAIKKYKQINSEVVDQILNIIAIKAGNQEQRLNEKVFSLAAEEQHLFSQRHVLENAVEVTKLLISTGIIYFIVISVDNLDWQFEEKVELLIILGLYILQIFSVITDSPALIKKTGEHFERLASTFDLNAVRSEEHLKKKKLSIQENLSTPIEINHLTFGYIDKGGDEIIIFKDLNLTIPPGISTAILGESGRGKSTLANILMRFYIEKDGQILIENTDVSRLRDCSVRELMSYAPQHPSLIQGTIRDNICFFNPFSSDEEIQIAAKVACIDMFIDKFPDKYDTDVGSLGDKLSGGQRQRIIIARALLKSCPIYIFDESSSAMNQELSLQVTKNILEFLKGKTLIFLTHDPAIYNLVDNKVDIGIHCKSRGLTNTAEKVIPRAELSH